MKAEPSALNGDYDNPLIANEEDEIAHEDDLWFLPRPFEEEPDDLPPGPRAEPPDTAVVEDWAKAESDHAARLARVASRLGAAWLGLAARTFGPLVGWDEQRNSDGDANT